MFYVGLLAFLVAAASLAWGVTAARQVAVRAIASVGAITLAVVTVAVTSSAIDAGVSSTHWVSSEASLWIASLALLAIVLRVRRGTTTPVGAAPPKWHRSATRRHPGRLVAGAEHGAVGQLHRQRGVRWEPATADVVASLVDLAGPRLGEATTLEAHVQKWRYATPRTPWPDPCWESADGGEHYYRPGHEDRRR